MTPRVTPLHHVRVPDERVLRAPVPGALLDGAADALADAFADQPSAIGHGTPAAARRLLMRVPAVVAARRGGLLVVGEGLDRPDPVVLGASCWVPAGDRGAGPVTQLRTGSWRLVSLLGPVALGRVMRQATRADSQVDAYLDPGDAYLSVVGVRPGHHGAGLGRRLVEATAADAAQAGLTRLVLLTHAPGNVPFYRRLGFQVVDDSTRSRGHPLHVLARPLTPGGPRR